jgi:ribose transport system substrate-binding protein
MNESAGARKLPKRRQRTKFSILGAVAVALLLAACSSSSKSSTTPTTGSAGAAGSATTASSGSSATTASGASSASGGSGLAAAQAMIAQYQPRPTQITDTAKTTKPIPPGKTLYFIPCGPGAECQQEGQIVRQATDILGWKTVIVPNDGSPQQTKAAFDQVVRAKPAGVLFTAIPQATFQSEIPAMQANGTVTSACCETDPVGHGIDYNVDTPQESGPVGKLQAAFVASDSKCNNAESVIVNIPALLVLNSGVANYKSGMQQFCPGAKVDELDIALANITTAPTSIVSYVRSHPSVKYVVASTDGVTIGLPGALAAAGLSHNVKLVGQGATASNIQYLHSGQEAADVAFAYYENMWSMVNAVVQKVAGQTIQPSVAPPLWLLLPSNAPASTGAAFPVVQDYATQYKALWGKS